MFWSCIENLKWSLHCKWNILVLVLTICTTTTTTDSSMTMLCCSLHPQNLSSHRKQAGKPNTMPSSSFHACLPHVVLSWDDKKQSDRVHVVIAMPSGMHLLKKQRSSALILGLVLVLIGKGHRSCLILSKFCAFPLQRDYSDKTS